jgi:sodium/hydrogen antiporter
MQLAIVFGILATVLIGSALAAGLVERAPLTFPMLFLGLGLLAGPRGIGLISVSPDTPVLEVLATLTLSLILFLDAVNLERTEERRDLLVPLLALGPGTLFVILLGSLAAILLLQLPLTLALLVGAILASTDPVVLRDVTRNLRIPAPVRRALSIEAGANDIIVLPIVLILIAVMQQQASSAGQWATFLLKLLVLGPAAGFVIGGAGAWLMARVDQITPIRREYQALYGLGLVLGAYAAGSTIGVDGFLASFAAGLAVTVLNQTLCNCFLEYGEATAEMSMLLAFVLFGALLSTLLDSAQLGPTLLLAAVVIVLVRPLAMALVLIRAPSLSLPARALIAWFGPRGLTSLLFALLVVSHGVPRGVELLTVIGTVVVISVIVHGMTANPAAAWYTRIVNRRSLGEERESTASGLFAGTAEVPRVTPEELAAVLSGPDPPILLDVRSRSEYARDRSRIPGSIRVLPDQVEQWAQGQSKDRPLVLYCT